MDVDLGALMVRLALGPMLFLHGWNKLRGPSGLAGTAAWFADLGLRPARLHAAIAATGELIAGVMMTFGLLTGLAATAFVGLMVVAMLTDHRGKGYFVFRGGWEYTLLVAMVSVSVAAMGPGRWSLDHAWGLRLDGTGCAVISAVVGCALALGLVAACHRPNRAAEAGIRRGFPVPTGRDRRLTRPHTEGDTH